MAELNIHGMRFYGYHGVYASEKEKGGEYEVDVTLRWKADSKLLLNDDLEGTINYEKIYTSAQKIMATPVDLIENLAIRIFQDIQLYIPSHTYLQVKVRKLSPPLNGPVDFTEFIWDGS